MMTRANASLQAQVSDLGTRNAALAAENERLATSAALLARQKFDLEHDVRRLESEVRTQLLQVVSLTREVQDQSPVIFPGRPATQVKIVLMWILLLIFAITPIAIPSAYVLAGVHIPFSEAIHRRLATQEKNDTVIGEAEFLIMTFRSISKNEMMVSVILSFLYASAVGTLLFNILS